MRHSTSRAALAAILVLLPASIAGGQEPPAFVAEVDALLDAEDYDAASELLDAVSGPDRPWADHYLGRIALRRDDFDGAIERFGAAVEATPDSPLFQRWLGSAYIDKLDTVNAFAKLGLAKKAQTAFEEAVRLAPSDQEAREDLVDFYLNAPPIAGGSKEKAAQQVAELKELQPALGNALQGRIHTNEEEWPEAEAAYRAALETDPENADYLYIVGFSLQQQEKHEAAFEAFEKAIEAEPDTVNAYYQLGRTAVFAESNLERGAECLETYLGRPQERGAPGKEHAWWRLGMLRELQGDDGAARAAYGKALEIEPEHEDAKKALAKLAG